MRWRRLGWAGVELEADGESLVIDHLLDPGILGAFLTSERDEFVTPEPEKALAALVTHLHRDHTDVAAIGAALSDQGTAFRPMPKPVVSKLEHVATGEAEQQFAESALAVETCAAGHTSVVGPFTVTALFASDGLGSPQVSWLIEADGRKVLHGGDTLWHAQWWDIAAIHGAPDVAFLPANGAMIAYPGWQPAAEMPAVLTPEQAVAAAAALQAKALVPIHYNRTFEHADYYRPVADAEERILERAAELPLEVHFSEPGAWFGD